MLLSSQAEFLASSGLSLTGLSTEGCLSDLMTLQPSSPRVKDPKDHKRAIMMEAAIPSKPNFGSASLHFGHTLFARTAQPLLKRN